MKTGTVALIISDQGEKSAVVEILSDNFEIQIIEEQIKLGRVNPLQAVYSQRAKVQAEESDFGDYVEALLSKPFLHPEIQKHAVQWLKSKIRIEKYQKTEGEAAKVIADYAYKIYQSDPSNTDFILASANSNVRIRIFRISAKQLAPTGSSL